MMFLCIYSQIKHQFRMFLSLCSDSRAESVVFRCFKQFGSNPVFPAGTLTCSGGKPSGEASTCYRLWCLQSPDNLLHTKSKEFYRARSKRDDILFLKPEKWTTPFFFFFNIFCILLMFFLSCKIFWCLNFPRDDNHLKRISHQGVNISM